MRPAASFKVIGYGERMVPGVPFSLSVELGICYRSKIIENLAVVGYDTNNLYLAPYDWRLSFWNLEERDGYFSRLQRTIEGFKCGHPPERRVVFLTFLGTGGGKRGRPSSPHTPWDQRFVTKSLTRSFR